MAVMNNTKKLQSAIALDKMYIKRRIHRSTKGV